MKAQFLVVAVLGLALGSGEGRGAGEGKGESIQGTWTVVSIEDSGKKQDIPKDNKVTITKDKITIEAGGKTVSEHAYKLDSSKSPKWIDVTARGEKMPGIYELKDDVLKICNNENPRGKRSTRFESKANSENEVLMVFKRAKP